MTQFKFTRKDLRVSVDGVLRRQASSGHLSLLPQRVLMAFRIKRLRVCTSVTLDHASRLAEENPTSLALTVA